ncbi:MAG: hypothetical protein ACP5TO_03975 [Thermoplasmata archaeon]
MRAQGDPMYPMFSLAGKGVKISAQMDITEKIMALIKDLAIEPEISMQIKDYIFRDLTIQCQQGYALAINYGHYAKVIYPERLRNEIFIRDRFSISPFPKTKLVFIGDLWQRGNKKFYRISNEIQGKEKIKVIMENDKIYYMGRRVIVFGKREKEMVVQVAGQIRNTIYAYRWYQ